MRTVWFAIASLWLVVSPGAADERPNIVLILADDLGYGDLSCYRDDATSTPNSDRIAARGLRFTDAHSPSSVCTPTRYGVLTGRYAWRTWLKDWVHNERMPLLIADDRPTLPGLLRSAGYQTACVGKWHLGWGRQMNSYQRGITTPGVLEVGFDDAFVVPFSHNSSPSMEHFVRGRSIVGWRSGDSLESNESVQRLRRSLTDTATDLSREATEFIRKAATHPDPFFLYYPTTNVHFPITPHRRFVQSDVATIDSGVALKQEAAARRSANRDADYAGFVREFDWAVGEVLAALEAAGVAKNTIVIVTSDNGGSARTGGSNAPWRGDKGECYEGGHRVPLIVSWPESLREGPSFEGEKSQELVCLTDIMPTLLVAAGEAIPEGVAPDGQVIATLSDSTAVDQSRTVVHHSVAGMFAIRRGPWKLIDGLGGGKSRFRISVRDLEPQPVIDASGRVADWSYLPEPFPQAAADEPPAQLYHLASDPGETTNLFFRNPRIAEDLAATLRAIRECP